ncbi:MAG: hypothetical protein AABX17_04350 [Nanoarchaeota archaeon]
MPRDYFPLWMLFASNIVDLDHLFRLFSKESPIKQEYGLDKLIFHRWWNIFPISILFIIPGCNWFALGWALHIFLDGLMVRFRLNSFLIPLKP